MVGAHTPGWGEERSNKSGPGCGRYQVIPPSDGRLVEVRATVPHGFVPGPSPWPCQLDGILAWVDHRIMRGVRPDQRARTAPSLPLVQLHPEKSRRWVWLASCALWDDNARWEERPWGRRPDEIAARRLAGHEGRWSPSGPDKPVWSFDDVALVGELRWRAVGDPGVIREWVGHVDVVGRGGSRGEGQITGWDVIDHGPVKPDGDPPGVWRERAIGWVVRGESGGVLRPMPAVFATDLGIDRPVTVTGAQYRPPYVSATNPTSDTEVLSRW